MDHARQSANMRALALVALLLLAPAALAQQAISQVCFTPGGACTDLVVGEIGSAQKQILIQAYSFTSVPILAGLKAAHARGVDVEVIVDKSSARVSKSGRRYRAATYLTSAGIPVWVDTTVAIAQGHGDRRCEGYQWQLQLHARGAEAQCGEFDCARESRIQRTIDPGK
jgi:phosphatidylserine/phosphatidylglycerophosphate/cardiolipin synthase-like enzyme